MDQAAILDHQFRVAAYIITWVIQLGYLAWLGMKWRAQRRAAEDAGIVSQSNKSSR
jgi:threonine/homoserine/homoserine lactone efflux protein